MKVNEPGVVTCVVVCDGWRENSLYNEATVIILKQKTCSIESMVF